MALTVTDHGLTTGDTAMTATTFNPLAAARDLKAAGVEAEQAEAIAEGMRQAADAAASADRADLATKADLADLATKADIRWILTILGFQAALILAIAAKLFGIV